MNSKIQNEVSLKGVRKDWTGLKKQSTFSFSPPKQVNILDDMARVGISPATFPRKIRRRRRGT